MKQAERISQMERRLDRATRAVAELTAALDRYAAAQADISALRDYYASPDWRQDYAADEAGRLPAGLKRGVLSEDGIWNLLADCRELDRRLSPPPADTPAAPPRQPDR